LVSAASVWSQLQQCQGNTASEIIGFAY